jgi:DNA end-binding protein Ku
MAEQLVASLAGPFELDRYPDNYRLQVLDLLEKRAAGEEIEIPDRPATAPQVVDLMAALEASVKAAKESRGRHPTAKAADDDSDDAVAEVTDVAKRPARKAAAAKTTAKAAKAPAARKRKSA